MRHIRKITRLPQPLVDVAGALSLFVLLGAALALPF
jgi:hypothetical protein